VPALPGLRRRRRRAAPAASFSTTPAAPERPRPRSYYAVAGVALDEELQRLRALPVFADGPLARSEPSLKVRRAKRRPNRLGFAVPSEFRLSVTAYSGIRRGDVLETLLHELVHLHVGRAAEAHAWHGPAFRRALARAMREAYGVTIPPPRSTLHGVYAETLEREAAKTPLEEGFVRPR
jgi:hypothetical protein